MKRDDLLNYIGEVDSRFIEELFEEPASVSKSRRTFGGTFRAAVASLAVVVIGTIAMLSGIVGTDISSVDVGKDVQSLQMSESSIMMIDVNPSIEFRINDRNVVISFNALNDDAKKLSAKLDVVGKDYNEALEITLGVLKDAGYISELKNSVLITVVNDDEKRADEIRSSAVSTIDLIDDTLDLTVSVLSQIMTNGECKQYSNDYHVSNGKFALVEKICEANKEKAGLTVDTLVGSSIQVINQLLQYMTTPEGVQIVGAVAGVIPRDHLREVGLEDLDAQEIIELVGVVSDFFEMLDSVCADNGKSLSVNTSYELQITSDGAASGNKVWSFIADGVDGYTYKQDSDGSSDDYSWYKIADKSDEPINIFFGLLPDVDKETTETETETETENAA